MLVAPDKIPAAVAAFVDNELMPKAQPYTWQKGLLALGAIKAISMTTSAMQDPKVMSALKLYDVMTSDGAIDTVKGEEVAQEMIKGAGGSITYMGIVFNDADAKKFFEITRSV